VRDDVLRATAEHQRPFISASITGTPFMLVPGAGAAGPVSQAAAAVASDPNSVEMMYWQSASAGDDPTMLRAYLAHYPNGNFVELAKAKIAALERPAQVASNDRSLPSSPQPKSDPHATELAFWNSVSASNDIGQLTAYIDQYPSGTFVRAAKAKIAALGRPAAAVAAAPPVSPSSRGVGYTAVGVNAAPSVPTPPASQPLAYGLSAPQSRYGASDDYMCNHGDPGDPRTAQACKRLRGD